MTTDQMEQQMKDFLKLVDFQLENMCYENFEMLDVVGFVAAHADVIRALGLRDEFYPDMKGQWADE